MTDRRPRLRAAVPRADLDRSDGHGSVSDRTATAKAVGMGLILLASSVLTVQARPAGRDDAAIDPSGPGPSETSIPEALERCQQIEHGQPAEARRLAESLLERIDADRHPDDAARALGCLGWAQAQLGDAEARSTTDRLTERLPAIEDPAVRAGLMRRVAGLQQQTNRNGESIQMLMAALELADAEGLDGERISLLINLGIAHSEAKHHEQAIEHYRTVLAELDANDGRRLPVLFNLGLTLRGDDRTQEAREVITQLLEPLSAPGLEIRLASLYSVLGSIEIELGNLDAAEDYLARSDALHATLDNPGEHAALLIERTSLALELGRPDDALRFAREALAEAERTTFVPSIRGALKVLSDALIAGERFEEATEAQRRYVEVSDAFWRDRMESRLEEAEARYGNERQARELAELRQSSQQQEFTLRRQQLRQQLLIGLGLAALVIAAGAFGWQRRHTRRLRRLSRTDPLTGLANRRQATEWLDRLEPITAGRWTILWLLDLDHFKLINDGLGHDAGDRVLGDVARRLRGVSDRHGLRPARWGGEEFLLIGASDGPEAAGRTAEALRRAIGNLDASDRDDRPIELTASIGFAPLAGLRRSSGQSGWEPAMLAADQLLYQAKQAGRNRWMGLWPTSSSADIAAHDLEEAVVNGRGRLIEGDGDVARA